MCVKRGFRLSCEIAHVFSKKRLTATAASSNFSPSPGPHPPSLRAQEQRTEQQKGRLNLHGQTREKRRFFNLKTRPLSQCESRSVVTAECDLVLYPCEPEIPDNDVIDRSRFDFSDTGTTC